ncbi:MAG: PTS sugar transporter subunit IIB [Candidatus Asgardarchaeia archaeon]
MSKEKVLRVLCVCGLGIGSSFILADNVRKVLEDLKVPAKVDVTDYSSSAVMNADVYVTNEAFLEKLRSQKPEAKIIVVKNYMDLEYIREKFEEILAEE